jgi:hypothetical protein
MRKPTPGQLANLQYALRQGRVPNVNRYGYLDATGVRLERRGWVDVYGRLTEEGRGVAVDFEIVEGQVREAGAA